MSDQKIMEQVLQSQLEQATWATSRVCDTADEVGIVIDAFEQATVASATLAIYRHLGSDMDVELLALIHAVRDSIRETCRAVKLNCDPGLKAMPGLRMPQDNSGQRDLLLGPFPDGADAFASADRYQSGAAGHGL